MENLLKLKTLMSLMRKYLELDREHHELETLTNLKRSYLKSN